MADANVAVFDMVVDCSCVRHFESFRDHDLPRVVWGVSAFEYEFLETNRHAVGDFHRAPLVSVAIVHRVLRLVLRILPDCPACKAGGVVASPSVDFAAERGLRKSQLLGELVLGLAFSRGKPEVGIVDEGDSFSLVES